MSPQSASGDLVREVPTLAAGDEVGAAVQAVVESGLPALPVVDGDGRLCGIFGEREFMSALFPGYVSQLGGAAFVKGRLDQVLEKRAACRQEPVSQHMNTEHIDIPADFSDVQVAETFLHHRVLILPVTEDHRPVGVITRGDFFRRLTERFLSATS